MPRGAGGEGQPLLGPVADPQDADRDTPGSPIQFETRRKAVRVLPLVVITYFISYIVCQVELNPFLYTRVAKEYNGSHMSSESPCSANMSDIQGNTSGKEIQVQIERRVATLEMYLGLTNFLVATVPIIVLGPLTDQFGRKLGFFFPVIGTFLKLVVFALTIGLDLPLGLLFIAHLFEAFGGGFAAMFTSMFSVISDVTEPGQRRANYITFMEATQTLVSSFTQIGVAIWIKTSFQAPLYLAMSAGLVSLMATMYMPETYRRRVTLEGQAASQRWRDRTRHFCRFIKSCLSLARKSFQLYWRDTETGRLTKRRLCLAVFVLTSAVNFSRGGPWSLYLMKYPLCWPATFLLTFNGVQMVVNWVAILLTMAFFRSVYNMADRHIAFIGCFSSLLCMVFSSIATNDKMVYEAVVMGMLVRSIMPMLRSMMSSLSDRHQQGAMYSSLGVIESFGAGVFHLVANKLYTASLDSCFPGAVFLLFAGLMAAAMVLLAILNVLQRREEFNRHPTASNTGVQQVL